MSVNRIAYIDALRGLAILGVIITHAAALAEVQWPARILTDAAGMGVQLFFVVSAFTIFLTFSKAQTDDANPIRDFFIKRLLRIVPVYWFGIALYTAVYGLGSRGWKDGPELWHYPLHITLTNVMHPATTSSVVPGGWSISCEVLFYMTVPLWFVLIKNVRSAALFVLLSAFLGVAFVHIAPGFIDPFFTGIPEGQINQYWYRSFPNQLACFALGILMFFIIESRPGWLAPLRHVMVNLSMLTAAAAVMAIGAMAPVFFGRQHYFALGFMLAGLCLSQIPWAVVVNRITTAIGKISYSGYLLHFLVLKQIYDLFPPGDMNTLVYFAIFACAGILATLPLAYLGFVIIEKPSTRLAHLIINRRNVQGTAREGAIRRGMPGRNQ